MAQAFYKNFAFQFGFSVLAIARERDIKPFKYPNRSGAEHEDLGAMPQIFTVEADFPGTPDGIKDLRKLAALFELQKPEVLFIPNLGTFLCIFLKFQETAEAGGNGAKRIEMEFVETLNEDLVIQRFPDELEDMGKVAVELKSAQEQAEKDQPVPEVKKSLFSQILSDITDFSTKARQDVQRWQQEIQEIQDSVTRPYNELLRLAADIEQTANKARSLFDSVAKFSDLPYTMAIRLKNTANILTSIGRRFLPPPVDRSGAVIADQFHGQVIIHTVVGGETLQSIALLHYDSALLWECLAEANGITDGLSIQIGDVLVVPDFGGRRPQRVEVRPGKTRIGQATCEV